MSDLSYNPSEKVLGLGLTYREIQCFVNKNCIDKTFINLVPENNTYQGYRLVIELPLDVLHKTSPLLN